MSKFLSLYNKLILEVEDEEEKDIEETDPTTDDWSSEADTDEEIPATDETQPDELPDDESNLETDDNQAEEEEPVEPPEEKDYSELEVQAKSETRVEDLAEKIADEMVKIAMDRFEAFRKVLKKKGIEQMTFDFIDNYYAKNTSSKIDSLFMDLYIEDIKSKTIEKVRHMLTDLSLKSDEVEEEPVPKHEDEQFWSM